MYKAHNWKEYGKSMDTNTERWSFYLKWSSTRNQRFKRALSIKLSWNLKCPSASTVYKNHWILNKTRKNNNNGDCKDSHALALNARMLHNQEIVCPWNKHSWKDMDKWPIQDNISQNGSSLEKVEITEKQKRVQFKMV